MKMALAVTTDHVRCWVSPGGMKPSPVPVVTLGLELYPLDGHVLAIEMSPGQTRHLIEVLQQALAAATGIASGTASTATNPEGT